MHFFDESIDLQPTGAGAFRARLEHRWWIDRGPNGGFLAGVLLKAIEAALTDEARSPLSVTVHYQARPEEGDVDVSVEIHREGRSMTSAEARMFQGGRLIAVALCATSTPRSGEAFDFDPMPEVPAPEDIPEITPPENMLPRFSRSFDYRWAYGDITYSGGERATTGGWLRIKEGRKLDAPLLATFTDAWPPSVFSMRTTPAGVPTIDLTVHFLGPIPDSQDWVFVRFLTESASNGVLVEDGKIWSRAGVLLAQSRQLALYLTG